MSGWLSCSLLIVHPSPDNEWMAVLIIAHCAPHAGKELREHGVTWSDVFVEVPIKINNSSLAQALIAGGWTGSERGHS